MSEDQIPQDEGEQIALRRTKLAELREQGRAFPNEGLKLKLAMCGSRSRAA